MANQKLVDYLKQYSNNGYSIEQLKHHLISSGYNQNDVNEAAGEVEKSISMPPIEPAFPQIAPATKAPTAPAFAAQPPKSSSHGGLIVLVVVLIILIGGIAGGYFYFKAVFTSLFSNKLINQAGSGYNIYDGGDFSIQYPSDWKQGSSQVFQAVFWAPTKNGFTANLGITKTNAGGSSIDDIGAAAKNIQNRDYPQFKVLDEKSITIDGRPAFRRTYSWHNDQYNFDVVQNQVWVKDGETLYTITSTSLSAYDSDYEPAFSTMIGSFKIKSSSQSASTATKTIDYSIFKDQISCGSGYIRHGISCCADSNSNGICDVDEGLIRQEDKLRASEKLSCGKGLAKFFYTCCVDTNNNGFCDFMEDKNINQAEALQEFLTINTEFADAVFDCKAPYLKIGSHTCCISEDGKTCSLGVNINLKSVKTDYDGKFGYILSGIAADYTASKDVTYDTIIEAFDGKNQLVSTYNINMAFKAGSKTGVNLLNSREYEFSDKNLEFQNPGVYSIKLRFFDPKDKNTEITSKTVEALVGVTNKNPTGAKFDAIQSNALAKDPGCYWLEYSYTYTRQNTGDTDFIYYSKSTYTVDGSLLKQFDSKPQIVKAGDTITTQMPTDLIQAKVCTSGKTLTHKIDYLDRSGNILLTKEFQIPIVKA